MVAVWVAQQREKGKHKTSTPMAANKSLGDDDEQCVAALVSPPSSPLPSARRIAWFLFRDPQSLSMAEQAVLTQMKEACCDVEVAHTLVQLVQEFVRMQRNHMPD